MNKTIPVCNNCQGILVFTMKFPGAESYCMACGSKWGMFNTKGVPETPKMLKEYYKLQNKFDKISAPIVFRGCQRVDCDKCVGRKHHADHLTDKEQADHTKALHKLEEINY